MNNNSIIAALKDLKNGNLLSFKKAFKASLNDKMQAHINGYIDVDSAEEVDSVGNISEETLKRIAESEDLFIQLEGNDICIDSDVANMLLTIYEGLTDENRKDFLNRLNSDSVEDVLDVIDYCEKTLNEINKEEE